MDPVGLNIRIKKRLVGASRGLRIVSGISLLDVIEYFRLGHEDDPDVPFYWTRLPDLRITVRPSRHPARHGRAWGHRSIHSKCAESPEKRTVE